MKPKRLAEAWAAARRGRLVDGLDPDETWEFAWEVVNHHNQLAAQHGVAEARRTMKRELLALSRAEAPIPDAARQLVQRARDEGLILAEVRRGADGPARPHGRGGSRRTGN
jgi:hypothetical protein